MRLTYEAVDETGKDVADVIEAISAADATETLEGLGLTVTTISEVRRARVATNAWLHYLDDLFFNSCDMHLAWRLLQDYVRVGSGDAE